MRTSCVETEETFIPKEEKKRDMPAARCRDCGTVTWVMNLSTGAWKISAPLHEYGCEKPLGRLDVKASIPLALQPEELSKPMSDESLGEYATDIHDD